MVRPRLTWSGVLLAVLIICAIALTLAGNANAVTFDELGKKLAPANIPTDTTAGITGGTPAPAYTTTTLRAVKRASPEPNNVTHSGWNTQWLIILGVIALVVLLGALIGTSIQARKTKE